MLRFTKTISKTRKYAEEKSIINDLLDERFKINLENEDSYILVPRYLFISGNGYWSKFFLYDKIKIEVINNSIKLEFLAIYTHVVQFLFMFFVIYMIYQNGNYKWGLVYAVLIPAAVIIIEFFVSSILIKKWIDHKFRGYDTQS